MKLKNKIIGLILAFVLIVPTMLLVACGDDADKVEYAWGKSFSYQGIMNDTREYRYGDGTGNGGSTIIDLIKQEYSKGNLDFANVEINDVATDLTSNKGSSVEDFFNKLKNIADTKLRAIYNGITFKIGTEEELTFAVNDKVYSVRKGEGAGFNQVYDEALPAFTYLALFTDDIYHQYNNAPAGNLNLQITYMAIISPSLADTAYNITIKIPTKTICADQSAFKETDEKGQVVSTYIMIQFNPMFSKVEA